MIDEKKLIEAITNGEYTTGNILSDMELQQFIKDFPKSDVTEKIGEWIPCSERLPERDGAYQLKEFEVTVDNGERIYTIHAVYDFHNEKWLVHKKKVIAWKQKCEPYHKGE